MMGRILRTALSASLILGLSAAVVPSDDPQVPDWMSLDEAAKTVTIDLVAGMTPNNNSWNYNGYKGGEATIVVPLGYTVKLNFTNKDAAMTHSVGVGEMESTWPAMYTAVTPIFVGAVSAGATDMAKATMPEASETIEFVADKAGDFALICYLPAHATTGMWLAFTVSEAGQAGLIAQ